MKRFFFVKISSVILLSSFVSIFLYRYFEDNSLQHTEKADTPTHFCVPTALAQDDKPVISKIPHSGLNFVHAASLATPAVVHIKAIYDAQTNQQTYTDNPLEELFKNFFGDRLFDYKEKEYKRQPSSAFGSGVIITSDGYIVTNYHVVRNADHVEVTLNDNQRFNAKIIGTDPSTDLAVLKIQVKDLSYLTFGSSDELAIGEWVLAVGNPFDLTSTVTAGIVSAKARALNGLGSQGDPKNRIFSFIQTDAAVNVGNSGGALVNLQGELVGINTAIYAPNSTFAGYSFAIPSSIVKKVTHDLIKHGSVQRGILGIIIRDMDAEFAKEKKLAQYSGVYIIEVNKNSAADRAGLKKDDIIIAINDQSIRNTSQLQEQVACHQPGDKIKVLFYRKGKKKEIIVTLKIAPKKQPQAVQINANTIQLEGATFENTTSVLQKKLNIQGGVQIKKLTKGKWQLAGMQQGFIITAIDRKNVRNVEVLKQILDNKKEGGILIEGLYIDGKKAYYAIGWD